MIDWQAYEAGTLTEQDKARAENVLKSDPLARAEIEGLRRFRRQIETTKYVEPVPLKSLKAKLSTRRVRNNRLVTTWAAIAVLTVLALGISTGKLGNFGFVRQETYRLETSDLAESGAFLKERSSIMTTSMTLPKDVTLQSVSCTQNWVRYEMAINGKKFTLSADIGVNRPFSAPLENDVRKFLVREHDGIGRIGWRNNGLIFSVTGLPLKDAWPVSIELRSRTAAWKVKNG